MDRLAEINRPLPANRPEASDLARAKPTRSEREERTERPERNDGAERRETAETRAAEARDDRERGQRAGERPERFSQVLGEQQAAVVPGAKSAAAARETDEVEPKTGETTTADKPAETGEGDAQPANEPKLAAPTQAGSKPRTEPSAIQVEPRLADPTARIDTPEPVDEIPAPYHGGRAT